MPEQGWREPPPDSYVYVTDDGVSRQYADGSVEALGWHDVTEVRVVAVGPAGDDATVVLYGLNRRGCVVPLSATDASFLVRLQELLPGFDTERFVAVLTGRAKGQLVVWRAETDSPFPFP